MAVELEAPGATNDIDTFAALAVVSNVDESAVSPSLVGTSDMAFAPAGSGGSFARTVERVHVTQLSDGSTRRETVGRYAELASGLQFQDPNGAWAVSSLEPGSTGSGGVAFENLPVKFRFGPNANAPVVVEMQRGDMVSRSAVAGLGYVDAETEQTHVIAWVKNAAVRAMEGGAFYPDAFAGAMADIRYRLDRAKFQQDIVIYGLPDPAIYGLNANQVRLCVLTELQDVQAGAAFERDPGVAADHADASPMAILAGEAEQFHFDPSYAFAEAGDWVVGGDAIQSVKWPLLLRVFQAEGRTFLSEEVPLGAVLAATPGIFVSGEMPSDVSGKALALSVPPRRPTAPAEAIREAADRNASTAYVVDYQWYYGTVTSNLTLRTGETYYIPSELAISNATLSIEPGCIVKLATGAFIRVGAGTKVQCRSHVLNPALFTSAHDNSTGETIVASTGVPDTKRYAAALVAADGTNLLEGLQIRYARTGVKFDNPTSGPQWLRHSRFTRCNLAVEIAQGSGDIYMVNNLVHDSTQGVWAAAAKPYIRAWTFESLSNAAVVVTGTAANVYVQSTLIANCPTPSFTNPAVATASLLSNGVFQADGASVSAAWTLVSSPFVSNSFGAFFLTQTVVLVNGGNAAANAGSYGLYHFTTVPTNRAKEAATVVDIGFHYGATNDTDEDGLADLVEDRLGDGTYSSDSQDYADWTALDTDGDGLDDGEEFGYGTNPKSLDTDGDNVHDDVEIEAGSDPLDAGSYPATVQGTVTYSGTQTGDVHITATSYDPLLSNRVLSLTFSTNTTLTSGTVLLDESPGANHGTAVSGATWTNAGVRGSGGFSLTGSSDRVVPGRTPSLVTGTTTQFTLSVWINPDSDHEGYIMGRARSANNDLAMYINDGTGEGILYTLKTRGTEHFLQSRDGPGGGLTNPTNGSWLHLVAVYDGTNWSAFANGSLLEQTVTNGYAEDNLNDFLIGNRHTLDRQFKGRVDDVKVYRRGLTAAEVTNLYLTGTASTGARTNSIPAPGGYTNAALPNLRRYAVSAWLDRNASGAKDGSDPRGDYTNNPVFVTNAVTGVNIPLDTDTDGDEMPDWWEQQYGMDWTNSFPTNRLVARWALDEARGSWFTNSVANTNHAAIEGTTAAFGEWGRVGRAARFSGTNDPDGEVDLAEAPSDGSLNIQTQITLAAWIRPRTIDASAGVRKGIVQKTSDFLLNLDAAKPAFYWAGMSSPGYHQATGAVATGVWSHLAATYNGTTMVLFVNGQTGATVSASWVGGINSNAVTLGNSSSGSRAFDGCIDDARIYNVGLASNQVRAIMSLGVDADSDGLCDHDEWAFGANPVTNDADGDGIGDYLEASYLRTDPAVSNAKVTISGELRYNGANTGGLVVLVSPLRHGWSTNLSQALVSTGVFFIANVPVGPTNYFLKAFRDFNVNGVWDAADSVGLYTGVLANLSSDVDGATVRVEKIKGMRVDPGRYYNGPYDGITTTQAVGMVITNALQWGVNTIYVKLHSSKDGVFWPATSRYVTVEGNHGKYNFVGVLAKSSHWHNIRTVGALWEAHNFKKLYEVGVTNAAVEEWRAKRADGTYNSNNTTKFILSPFNTNFVNWLEGLTSEALDLGLDGIEVTEVDYQGEGSTDATYDDAATNAFASRFPGVQIGVGGWQAPWQQLRAEVLASNIYGRIVALAHARTNRALDGHFVYTWTADDGSSTNRGKLLSAATVTTYDGLNFDYVMDLPDESRPDFMLPEIMWQAWVNNHSDTVFNASWTAYAASAIVSKARGRLAAVGHVELDSVGDVSHTNTPIISEIHTAFGLCVTNSLGIDFYDHSWARTNQYPDDPFFAGPVISNVVRGAP